MAKKSFTDNPAMAFIKPQNASKEEAVTSTNKENVKDTYTPPKSSIEKPINPKTKPMYTETKSKRVNLLMQPSLHYQLALKAQTENTSLNNLIHSILEQHIHI